ncbi:MAG: MFS transporter [Bacteroides sp.]|nr:MFS transporter [Bacteroides sp.]
MTQSSSTPTVTKRGIHYGFIIVICCCLMMGVNVGLAFSCAGIYYKPVSAALGVPVGEFGIYMSVMYITSTLMLSVAGNMIEKWSARWLFTASSFIMGATFLSMGFFNQVWEFYVAGGILGITLAFLLYLSYPTLVNRWFQTKMGLMIGICCAASGIGGMLFNPMAGWIITNYGWRWGYMSFGIIILVIVTPLLALLLRNHPADKGLLPYGAEPSEIGSAKNIDKIDGNQKALTNDSGIKFSNAVKMPVFYVVILFAFMMMGISTLNLFIPGYVTDHHFSLEEASLTAAVVMAGVTIGKLALGWVNDRNCTAGVTITTLAGASGLLILLFGTSGIYLILTGAFLFGWAYAGVTVQTAMLTRKVFGQRDYSRIFSIVSIALAAGGALASAGWGLLADATSTATIFIVGTICLIGCFALGIWAIRK